MTAVKDEDEQTLIGVQINDLSKWEKYFGCLLTVWSIILMTSID